MATYDNANTGVVHWVPDLGPGWMKRTVCHFLDQFRGSWNWKLYDPVGVPSDVTCCKCRETGAWLDAAQKGTSDVT
jgi:hypothetical protein